MIIKIASTEKEKSDALTVRQRVFVVEQGIPLEIELDEHDETATHFVGYINQEPVCASRLRVVNNYGKLERICVLKRYRGKAYGAKIIQVMEKEMIRSNVQKSTLNAQLQTKNFYEKYGYRVTSEPFVEADILHVTMEKNLI